MKLKFALMMLFVALLFVPLAHSQTDGDTVVSVPKKYVSPEGLNHTTGTSEPSEVSKWNGIGKEIGDATKDGLNAVVDASEKFGTTRVGVFVMVMIAWKILSHDLIGIFLGIPILVAGVLLWWQVMKHFFFGFQVLDKKEGRVKTYKRQEPYDFSSSDARVVAGIAAVGSLALFLIVMLTIIF